MSYISLHLRDDLRALQDDLAAFDPIGLSLSIPGELGGHDLDALRDELRWRMSLVRGAIAPETYGTLESLLIGLQSFLEGAAALKNNQ